MQIVWAALERFSHNLLMDFFQITILPGLLAYLHVSGLKQEKLKKKKKERKVYRVDK